MRTIAVAFLYMIGIYLSFIWVRDIGIVCIKKKDMDFIFAFSVAFSLLLLIVGLFVISAAIWILTVY